ncbi:MAG: hypothetical protein ACHQT9_00100 [Candidatus Saccharimonadales bacterium]
MKSVKTHATLNEEGTKAFDDLYEEISRNWQYKAEALKARRWKKLDTRLGEVRSI